MRAIASRRPPIPAGIPQELRRWQLERRSGLLAFCGATNESDQAIRIRAGDVIVTPPGEWHWHGAAPSHFMAHLAFTEGDTEWGEHLTADEYPSEQ